MKGESVDELMGFMDAIEQEQAQLPIGSKPTIILPSYNGARKQVNTTPLLAGLLTLNGFDVIVQGIVQDDTRVTSYAIFQALGWPMMASINHFPDLRAKNLPVFCPLGVISPKLQHLLDIRLQIGLRNSGHVLAKLINPFEGDVWQISNYTHPEYPQKLKEYFLQRSSHAILMRGNEGEPTASLHRLPEMHFLMPPEVIKTTEEERFEGLDFQPTIDAIATASWTADVLGQPTKSPASLLRQAELIQAITQG
jgi:anthranilate phosphoribosyltransferase